MPRKQNSLTKRLNKLERTSRPEVKFSAQSSGAFDDIGSVSGTLITPQRLQQGIGRNNRIGDKVKSRNMRFQAILKMPSAAANPTCAVRILVLRSKKTYPTTTDMPTWYGVVDEDKFFVVKDILTQVSCRGGEGYTGTGSTLRKVKFNVPLGLRKAQYDGSSSLITDNVNRPLNNETFIYILAENMSAEVAWNAQHYYVDN